MKCINCRFYDKSDMANSYGTCEPQDEDFHATHECNLSENELIEIEKLTGKNRKDERLY